MKLMVFVKKQREFGIIHVSKKGLIAVRIGIDVREFKKGTYTGLRTILFDFLDNVEGHSSGNEFVFFGNQGTDFDKIPCAGEKVCLKEGNAFIWDQFVLPVNLKNKKIDLFYSPYIKTPIYRSCRYVNTVCDIIPLMISKYKGLFAILEKIHFFLYSYICSRRSTLTITLSEDAKTKICKTFSLDPGKVRVVYPSIAEMADDDSLTSRRRELVEKYGLDRPYMLYVGNFKKHKNVLRLIDSFKYLSVDIKEQYRIILLGGTEEQCRKVNEYLVEKELENKALVISNVKHDEVSVFMRNAALFVFPTLAEGFGIPPVEAMKAGVAVAASNLPPMTEVLKDAAIYFDPYDPEDIACKVSELLNDKSLLNDHIKRGSERACAFSPDKMSERLFRNLEFAAKEKIVCLSSEYPPVTGGIATQLFNLWNNFPKDKTLILTSRPEGAYHKIKSNITILRRKYQLGGTLVARILRTFSVIRFAFGESRSWNIKCLHCAQVLSSGLAGLLFKQIKGLPYVVYIYSADILEFSKNPITRYLINKILKESKAIIANSLFTKSIITGRIKNVEDKVVVSTPVIDPARFDVAVSRDEAREELDLPLDKKIILTVARLSKRKGHDAMIKTVENLIKEGNDLLYLIVGDGPCLEKLKEMVKERSLTEYVRFCGKVPQDKLQYYYKASDVFCMIPKLLEKEGDSEGFGIVFLEAAICSIPVIAGASGGVKEAVLDGETGLLVEPDNIDAIKSAIKCLLNDEELAGKFGQNGKKRVEKDFDIKSRVEELIGIS